MRSLQQWLDEYSESHQNKTNKVLHFICVPLIEFSLIGLLVSIPSQFLKDLFNTDSFFLQWATVLLFPALIFYLRISVRMFFFNLIFLSACIIGNVYLQNGVSTPLWLISAIIFVVAWIGQFYGHKIEGKKPSFLHDIQFLLIGPTWIFDHLFSIKDDSKR